MTARRTTWSLAAIAALLAVLAAASCWTVTIMVLETRGGHSFESESDPAYIRFLELIRWQQALWSITPWLVLAAIVIAVLALSLAAVHRSSMHSLGDRQMRRESGRKPRPRMPMST